MSNQALLWLLLIAPWFTLLFMKREEIRRYMPMALFVVFTGIVSYFVGIYARLWYSTELAFPFVVCGAVPVMAIWVFKIAYGHFLRYITVKTVIYGLFSFVAIPWFGFRGLLGVVPYTNVAVFVSSILLSVLAYGYQNWQEEMMLRKENQR